MARLGELRCGCKKVMHTLRHCAKNKIASLGVYPR